MAGETRVAVIGHPVSHSRSPRMHTAAFEALGMAEWSYEAIDVAPERLAEFVAELSQSGLRGVNVTIPHKAAVVELCDVVSAEAVRAGSVNTLLSEPEGIRGESTDGRGLLWALGPREEGRALVLGAGGAARAVVPALVDADWDVAVAARRPQAAAALGVEVEAWPPRALPDLVVNATPVGQAGDPEALPFDPALLRPGMIVADLAYLGDGRPTALCRAAAAAGAEVVDGLEVLVGQGLLAFELFTGRHPPVDAMLAAARA